MLPKGLTSSQYHGWQTPPNVFLPLHSEFDFTVDAAASHENALLPRYWTEETNGLAQDWTGERVWCNPPYGRMQDAWVAKAAEALAEVAVLLIPARTDTARWHNHIFGKAEIRWIRGRIYFGGGDGGRAPFPSAVVIKKKKKEYHNDHRHTG